VIKKRVPTKYWRFAYDEDSLKSILESKGLLFPNFKLWREAKNKSIPDITSDLRVGGFIFLANFSRHEMAGTVRGVGKIIKITSESVEVSWKKAIPSWTLTLHKIASEQWAKEAVFCFNVKPVKEFKLDTRSEKLFPE
jgi:hypothetical protein